MLNIAHRGASGHFPENTLRAFSAAIEAHADMCELDVRTTGDGHLVVLHDATIERTTNGRGRIARMTLQEAQRFEVRIESGAEFPGEHIAALTEVFDLAAGRCGLNLELKDDGIERAVCDLVLEREAVQSTLVSAFDWDSLVRVRAYAPTISIGLLANRKPAQLLDAAVRMRAEAIAPRADIVSEDLCAAAHQRGLNVYAWTVDEPQVMRKLMANGVDGIMTNFPERLAQILGR